MNWADVLHTDCDARTFGQTTILGEGRGGDWFRNGGCHFLLFYSSTLFTVCGGNVKLPLLLFGSFAFWFDHARFSSFILLKRCICHLYVSDQLWEYTDKVDCWNLN